MKFWRSFKRFQRLPDVPEDFRMFLKAFRGTRVLSELSKNFQRFVRSSRCP
jgi:hypothetical protein